MVDVGLNPTRMTMSSPLDRPPWTPPLRLDRVRTWRCRQACVCVYVCVPGFGVGVQGLWDVRARVWGGRPPLRLDRVRTCRCRHGWGGGGVSGFGVRGRGVWGIGLGGWGFGVSACQGSG